MPRLPGRASLLPFLKRNLANIVNTMQGLFWREVGAFQRKLWQSSRFGRGSSFGGGAWRARVGGAPPAEDSLQRSSPFREIVPREQEQVAQSSVRAGLP